MLRTRPSLGSPATFLLAALLAAGCVGIAAPAPTDAAIPAAYRDAVESARQSLRVHEDWPGRSTFAVRAVRCRADGGLVVVFDQHGLRGPHAIALRGPDAAPDSWAGALGIADLEHDPEIEHFFSQSPEASCPVD
jgi:hypothetical protein